MANPIDTRAIGKLAEILEKSNLTQLEYEDESFRVSLSRQDFRLPEGRVVEVKNEPVADLKPAVSAETKAPETAEDASVDYAGNPNTVKSPMVGVVYLSSSPAAQNYVQLGDTVTAGDTICLIEAMKTFNPVKAHKNGKVTQILVETGDPVEYGAPLMIIE